MKQTLASGGHWTYRDRRPSDLRSSSWCRSSSFFLIASKPLAEANLLQFSWPTQFVLLDNLEQAFAARDYLMVIAYINSFILTVASVAGLVIFSLDGRLRLAASSQSAQPGDQYLGAGRPDRAARDRSHHLGPTNDLGLFKTMPGLILIEIAFGLPFCILLFRAFISTVPRELDEAAMVDGAGPLQIFFRVIFPMLRSEVMTVIICSRCSSTTTSRTRCTSCLAPRTRPFS